MSLSLHINETHQLRVLVENAEGQVVNVQVTWHSDNSSIASVNQNGLVTGGSTPGTAHIFASIGHISSAILDVINVGSSTPTPVLTSYSVTPASLTPAANTVDQILIQAVDQNSNPINQSGVTVLLFILGGVKATLDHSSGVTDATGRVIVNLTVGAAESYNIKAVDTIGRTGTSATIVVGAAQPIPPPPPPPPPPPDTTPFVILLTNGNFTLNRGETQPIVAIVKNAEGVVLTTPVLVYHSATPANVTINSSTGIVTGVGAGTSIITATLASPSLTSNSLTLTCTGLPDSVPASITILTQPFSDFVGATHQMNANVLNAESIIIPTAGVVWFTDTPLVATINDQTGLLTFQQQAGTATINCSNGSIQGLGVVVTNLGPVTPPPIPPPIPPITPPPSQPPPATQDVPANIIISITFSTLNIGETEQLGSVVQNSGGVRIIPIINPDNWTSDNTAVATIDLNGVITGKSAGVANITASYGSVISSPLPITVIAPDTTPATVNITPVTLSLQSGGQQVTATVKNAAGTILPNAVVTWTSTTPSVAIVSTSGSVSFVSAGTSNIQAHSGGIDSNICVCTCVASPPGIGTNYCKSGFDSGVFTDLFYNPYQTGISVTDDFTGAGKGKVLLIDFTVNVAGAQDDNKAILPIAAPTISFGQDIWWKGSCYIDPNALRRSMQRKLWRFERYNGTGGFPFPLESEMTSFDDQLCYTFMPPQAFGGPPSPANFLYIDPAVANLEYGNWMNFKMHMKINTVFGDGTGRLQLWKNGLLFLDKVADWIDPTWPSLNLYGFTQWQVGFQLDSGTFSASEYRLWDDLSLASTEAAL